MAYIVSSHTPTLNVLCCKSIVLKWKVVNQTKRKNSALFSGRPLLNQDHLEEFNEEREWEKKGIKVVPLFPFNKFM